MVLETTRQLESFPLAMGIVKIDKKPVWLKIRQAAVFLFFTPIPRSVSRSSASAIKFFSIDTPSQPSGVQAVAAAKMFNRFDRI